MPLAAAGELSPSARVSDWRLAWTLENRGAYADEPKATYLERSINEGRASDMPLLIEMFGGLNAAA